MSYYYEPFLAFSEVSRMIDDAFNTSTTRANANGNNRQVQGGENGAALSRGFQPKLDLHESTDKNLVTATFELPGLKKEDVTIDVHNNRLVISGETTFSKDTDENGYLVKERRRGRFSRNLPLPGGTKPDQIKASMEEGVLTVTFPKSSPEEATKRITIS